MACHALDVFTGRQENYWWDSDPTMPAAYLPPRLCDPTCQVGLGQTPHLALEGPRMTVTYRFQPWDNGTRDLPAPCPCPLPLPAQPSLTH